MRRYVWPNEPANQLNTPMLLSTELWLPLMPKPDISTMPLPPHKKRAGSGTRPERNGRAKRAVNGFIQIGPALPSRRQPCSIKCGSMYVSDLRQSRRLVSVNRSKRVNLGAAPSGLTFSFLGRTGICVSASAGYFFSPIPLLLNSRFLQFL